jgi:tRNA A-37 threonylcarbamoyl transferase component Bud32
MAKFNRGQESTTEIMVQYSPTVIHMVDRRFQSRRIFERSNRATSSEDLIYLRGLSTGASLIALVLAFLGTFILIANIPSIPFAALGVLGVLFYTASMIFMVSAIWRHRDVYLGMWQSIKSVFLLINTIGISSEGIIVYRYFAFLNSHFPWEAITRIGIINDFPGVGRKKKEALIEINADNGKREKLSLKSIRSIEERKLLVDAFKIYARRAVDVNDISRMVRATDVQDIAFTQLWSQALRSTLPRSSSSVLPAETLLQDGRFLIEKQIGGGGQGAVYLAEMLDVADQRFKVALKEYVLPDQEHLFDRKRAIEQFEREVHLLARLKHRNLANLVDAFIEDHRAYLVLEYLDGMNLRETVKLSGNLSPETCYKISLDLCNVLDYLHSLSPTVVHLDVSPENVIITSDGVIKLIDFNTSSDGSGLRTKLIAGKQHYMSPEQYRNEASPQCDIYSLGCTIFFMLTGIEPEPLTVLHPTEVRATVPKILDEIVRDATSLSTETRTKTVQALRDKLLKLYPAASLGSGV